MKTKLTLLALLISIVTLAQNGINYKAIIKDDLGNVVANDLIQVQFSILQGVGQTNVYQETHTPTTNINGLIIVNIGEGTTTDDFTDINWSADDHFLNVQVNIGSGLVDLGTTQFTSVPYAKVAENISGLEAIDEGNGIGWRLIDRNPDFYNPIGFGAIDFSNNGINGYFLGVGAIGDHSFAAGSHTTSGGSYSTALGFATSSPSYSSTVIGRYNSSGGVASSDTWVGSDPVFQIGIGESYTNRYNALTVYKNGHHTINSSTTGLTINSTGTALNIVETGWYGVYVAGATFYGAYLEGESTGLFTKSSNSSNPDIILGANSSANSEDDGILTSDPSYPSSDLYFRSNDGVIIELDDDDNESGSFIVRNGDNNGVFSVDESGTIRQNGSTIHSSDKRLKKDIENLSYGLTEILQLQPKIYSWKNKNQPQKSLGLIAQEVQPIINEIVVVQDDADKILGISYTELIPVLIKAIQEQQKIIDNEKSINAKQNSQLEALVSRIEQLDSNSSN